MPEMNKHTHESEHTKTQLIIDRRSSKNKVTAGILAILLGGIGIHKFYLGKVGWGLIYLLFSWTSIPMFLGFIEGIIYLTMSDKDFEQKYS